MVFREGACKCTRIRRQVQSCVICFSPRIEVLGKIVIGIAVSVRPDNPDFLSTDAIAQLREDTKLITDPVYAPLFINDGPTPSRRTDIDDWPCFRPHLAENLNPLTTIPFTCTQH